MKTLTFLFISLLFCNFCFSQIDTNKVFNNEIRKIKLENSFLWFYSFIYYQQDSLFIGRYNIENGKVDFFTHQNTKIPKMQERNVAGWTINDIAIDEKGNKWFTTYNGILKFNNQNWQVLHFDLLTAIGVLCDKNAVWFATNDRILKYEEDVKYSHYPVNAYFEKHYFFYITKYENSLYFAGDKNCIAVFDGKKWENLSEKLKCPFKIVEEIAFDKKNIWIRGGRGESPLAKYDGKKWEIFNSENSVFKCRYISKIFVQEDGIVWFATCGAGLIKFENDRWTVFDSTNSALPEPWIYDIDRDKFGNLWIATIKGLFMYDFKTFKKIFNKN